MKRLSILCANKCIAVKLSNLNILPLLQRYDSLNRKYNAYLTAMCFNFHRWVCQQQIAFLPERERMFTPYILMKMIDILAVVFMLLFVLPAKALKLPLFGFTRQCSKVFGN